MGHDDEILWNIRDNPGQTKIGLEEEGCCFWNGNASACLRLPSAFILHDLGGSF